MSDKYAALKQAAERTIAEEGDIWWDQEQLTRYPDTMEIRESDADFIEAASPATILDLLAEREADKARIAWLEKRLRGTEESLIAATDNIAELESRKVIVKWPDDGMDDCYDIWGPEHCRNNFDCGYNFSSVRHEEAIREACAAAGITLETGE